MRVQYFFFLIQILLFAVTTAGQEVFRPVDEAYWNPSFNLFRKRLIEAVLNHDTSFIVSVISDNIIISASNEEILRKWAKRNSYSKTLIESRMKQLEDRVPINGKEAFFQKHLSEKTMRGFCWNFERIIGLGGSFIDTSQTVFRAPYVWSEWPDSTEYDIAIVTEKAFLFSLGGNEILDTLSYSLIKQKPGFSWPHGNWHQPRTVVTDDGTVGRILGPDHHSIWDYTPDRIYLIS